MPPVSLEERTERIPELSRVRRFSEVPVTAIQTRLPAAKYVGSGGFCKVFSLESWSYEPSPAWGQPVVIKVCSAGFKELPEADRKSKQRSLERHWQREVNAHLALQGHPRVVRVFHTFQGTLTIPASPAAGLHHAKTMEVCGLVEEFCNQTSLYNFVWKCQSQPDLKQLWPMEHLASECAALMTQIADMQRVGIVHQDIKGDNVMVHLPPGATSLPLLKFGDLNGAQWEELTRHGGHWIGTIGFMPRRVRKLYLDQQVAAPNVGELNYDTYQMGKLLLRLLLEQGGVSIKHAEKDDLDAEDAEVRSAALHMLSSPAPRGAPDMELWVFGVLIALGASWDGEYTGAGDLLRLAPADAADALQEWARLCAAWQGASSSGAFWSSPDLVDGMARLYLRLAELNQLPPLDELAEAGVHTQEDEHVVECLDNFFLYGTRLAPVRTQVAAILAQRRAAAAAAAADAAAQLEEEERRRLAAPLKEKPSKPSIRSTAWETKVAHRAEAEAAFLEGPTEETPEGPTEETPEAQKNRKRRVVRRNDENAAANQLARPAEKRKAGGAGVGAAKRAKPATAAAAAAGGEAGSVPGEQGEGAEVLVLSSKLRLKDIWGEGAKPPADAPQLLGVKHAVAQMLADTVRAALAGGGDGDCVRLQLGQCVLRFGLTARRSVQLSRRQLLALAGDVGGCRRWNAFVDAALESWSIKGQEKSRAHRLRLLKPLLAR